MKINFFEGGRRISMVIAGISVAVYIAIAITGRSDLKDFGGLILWLICLWLFTVATGWIVRGFFGVPRGQDFRPSQEIKP